MTTKLRVPKRPRNQPDSDVIRVPAWLTRSKLMGYELWSDKPEPVEESLGGGFKNLVGWEESTAVGSFYFRLPSLDAVSDSSPVYLHNSRMRRVWLTINLNRRKMSHAESLQTVEAR